MKNKKMVNNKNIVLIIVLIAIAGSIYYINSTKVSIPDSLPEYPINEETIQDQLDVNQEPQTNDYITDEKAVNQKSLKYKQAPELTGIAGYLNTDKNLRIQDLKGKVILIDFWTYTCINCIRTLPYLKTWHDKYEEKGLQIIGVHTPEFKFEQEYDNVKSAVAKYDIKYPVVQDNAYATWRDYQGGRGYWPHKYLIDIDGFVRYDHIGEGGYEETERVIQELLKERSERMGQEEVRKKIESPENVVQVTGRIDSPEIYFGYNFARGNFGNEQGIIPNEIIDYKLPVGLNHNYAYLEGKWRSDSDYMELLSDEGIVALPYQAKVVNIVAGSEPGSEIEVLIDGRDVDEFKKGSHVEIKDGKGKVMIKDSTLYNVVDYEYKKHTVLLKINGKGFRIFTFTFG